MLCLKRKTWNEKLLLSWPTLQMISESFSTHYLRFIWFLVQVQMKMPSSCFLQPAAMISASKLRQHIKRPTERWEEPLGIKQRTDIQLQVVPSTLHSSLHKTYLADGQLHPRHWRLRIYHPSKYAAGVSLSVSFCIHHGMY